jgi:hypothetical protein
VEYFNYLGSLVTKDARRTCEIISRIAIAKTAFNNKKNLFHQPTGLNFKEETREMLHLEHSLVLVLEKNGEGQLD